MTAWKKVRLGDLCKNVYSGGTPKKSITEYYDGSIFWLNTKEINFNRIYETEKTISEKGLVNSSAKYIPENTVVVAMYGTTAGKVAIAKNEMTTNQACCNLIIDETKADYNFVYYYIAHNYKKLSSLANGGAQQNLNAGIIKDFEISLPPLSIQKEIASILIPLDDKIENNKKINHHLEQRGQELFEQVYYNGSPAQLGDIISTLESGSRPKGGAEIGGIPSIGAENIERFGQYDYTKEKFISLEYFKKLNRGVVHSGDVLLYKDGAYTGKVSMALDNFPHAQCAINEHVFILRPSKRAPSSFFLYFLLLYDENRQALFSRASSKAAQPGLNQTEVKTLSILLPTTEEIIKFDNTIAPIMHQIAKNANENRKLSTLRDTLLPKLLSGEIPVNQAAK